MSVSHYLGSLVQPTHFFPVPDVGGPLKKSKTQNYENKNNQSRIYRKVVKYSLNALNSSEHQQRPKERKQNLRSVEVSAASRPAKNFQVQSESFQNWPSWNLKKNFHSNVPQNNPPTNNFNPFLSNSPKASQMNLMSTLPCPLAPVHSLHPKVTRISTHSNYSLQFPQKTSFGMSNHSSVNPSTKGPFVSSSFHIQQKNQHLPHYSKQVAPKELKRTKSYVKSDPKVGRAEHSLVRTVSDPFAFETNNISQPSSQNHLLFSTDANISMISSPNRQSINNAGFTSSILNESRTFNILSPNNLMMMPLGSISNETRVNIYSNSKQKDLMKKEPAKQVMTGRDQLDVVHENIGAKKCFTTSRQGLSGNSLTELLTGLRPKNPERQAFLGAFANINKDNSKVVYKKSRPDRFQQRIVYTNSGRGGFKQKEAKSQPKLRIQREEGQSSYLKKAKMPKKSFVPSNSLKPNLKTSNNLFNSFKKNFKENKVVGINLKNNFKKKKSKH